MKRLLHDADRLNPRSAELKNDAASNLDKLRRIIDADRRRRRIVCSPARLALNRSGSSGRAGRRKPTCRGLLARWPTGSPSDRAETRLVRCSTRQPSRIERRQTGGAMAGLRDRSERSQALSPAGPIRGTADSTTRARVDGGRPDVAAASALRSPGRHESGSARGRHRATLVALGRQPGSSRSSCTSRASTVDVFVIRRARERSRRPASPSAVAGRQQLYEAVAFRRRPCVAFPLARLEPGCGGYQLRPRHLRPDRRTHDGAGERGSGAASGGDVRRCSARSPPMAAGSRSDPEARRWFRATPTAPPTCSSATGRRSSASASPRGRQGNASAIEPSISADGPLRRVPAAQATSSQAHQQH